MMLVMGLRYTPVGGSVKSGGKRLDPGGYAERPRSSISSETIALKK